MKLLLDTHVALWAIADDERLSAKARSLIEDLDNAVFVSAASIWEIAIKRSLARARHGSLSLSAADALRYFAAAGYRLLAISPAHAAAVEELPRLHHDPFDRLLVAQAITEPLRLLSRDTHVLAYGGPSIAI